VGTKGSGKRFLNPLRKKGLTLTWYMVAMRNFPISTLDNKTSCAMILDKNCYPVDKRLGNSYGVNHA
jgi:hypothetical protein